MSRLVFKIPMKTGTQTGNLYDASNISTSAITAREMVFDDSTTALGSHNLIILDNDATVFRFAPINDAVSDSTNRAWSAKKTYDEIQAVVTGGIANGTVTSSTLRWDGADWIEETSFLVDASGVIDVQGGTVKNTIGNLTIDTSATGSIILNKDATFAGDIRIAGGDITTPTSTALAISPTTTLTLSPTTDLTLNPAGSLFIADDMTFNVAAARKIINTGGSLTIDASATGTITLGKDTSVTGDIYLSGGDITSTAALNIAAIANGALTLRAVGSGDINVITGTGKFVVTPDATFTGDIYLQGSDLSSTTAAALNIKPANNQNLNLTPTGTGVLVVATDSTFGGDIRVNGGDIVTPTATALNITPTTILTLNPGTNLVLDPTGYLLSNDDMTMVGARKIITTGGNLTLDSSTFLAMNKDTCVTGSVYASTNLDVQGTIQAGSSNVTITNANGYVLPTAIVGSEYQLIQVAAAGTTFTATTTLDCGTF